MSPTDPVLASSIVKGKFAESRVPIHIRILLSAESGANDGFAFPLVIFSMLLIDGNDSRSIVQSFLLDVIIRRILL